MLKESLDFQESLNKRDTSLRVTATRIFQNLQIDGIAKPTYEVIRRLLTRIRKHDRNPRNSTTTDTSC